MASDLFNKFITLEGGEGSGKTTVANELKIQLEKLGFNVILTREPGGNEVSEKIRDIILHESMDIKTEVLLFAAARNENIKNIIIPALKKGQIVICDRFVDSSIVYQEYVQKASHVQEINDYILNKALPKYTFFFDITPEIALKRLIERDNENRFDKKTLEFHNQVYKNYQVLVRNNQDRIKTINANQDVNNIVKDIINYLDFL